MAGRGIVFRLDRALASIRREGVALLRGRIAAAAASAPHGLRETAERSLEWRLARLLKPPQWAGDGQQCPLLELLRQTASLGEEVLRQLRRNPQAELQAPLERLEPVQPASVPPLE